MKLSVIGKKQDMRNVYKPPANDNKTIGNLFEEQFASCLKERGFWVHRLTQSSEGQPADIITQRNGCVWLIDCKVCMNDRFVLDRVEYNQRLSMNAWMRAGGTVPYFALLLTDNTVRMLSFPDVIRLEKLDVKSISVVSGLIDEYTCPLENWFTAVKLWEVKHDAQAGNRG